MALSLSEDFQSKVSLLIARNNNILDILTKFQDSSGKINRSVVKSATGCGCVKINAEKAIFDIERIKTLSPKELSGIKGEICIYCRERIENEIGETLFYLAGLCNALELSMKDIMKKELSNVEMLGKYSLK